MTSFYQLRLARHQKKMMRFLKYVVNDHFVLVCMIALGGAGFYYSSYIKTLTTAAWWGRPLSVIVLLFAISIGRLSTLMNEADSVFLLPKERQMLGYLKLGLRHSLLLPVVSLILVTGVLMPLLVVTSPIEFRDYWWLLAGLVIFKWSDLHIQLHSLYLDTTSIVRKERMFISAMALLGLVSALYVAPWLIVIFSVLVVVVLSVMEGKLLETHQLDWEKAISVERKRMKKVYSFFQLFTDVPGLASDIKRRPYMDPILQRIKRQKDQTFRYLYARIFVRGTEYSGLVIRLTLVGGLILFFNDSMWLSAIIGALFLYLIGFQLLPMYHAFDYMLMTQLYPLPSGLRSDAMTSLIRLVLSVVTGIFSILVLIAIPDKKMAFFVVVLFLLVFGIMSYLYVPQRLKKIEKK